MTIPDLSIGRLLLCGSALGIIIVISGHLELGLSRNLIISASRCALQLTILCAFVLEPMFSANRPDLIFGYLIAIMFLASREASARLRYDYFGVKLHFALSFLIGAGGVVAFAVALVLQLDPWWDARYLIPVAGTLLGNNLTATAIGADAFLADVAENTDKVELRLCRGANWREALLPSIRQAIAKAMAPTLNSMAIMGLVMLPGMMTGQILGGQSPLEAGIYQILIMYLVCVSGCIAATAVVGFAARAVIDTPNHALRRERILKADAKNRPNKDILIAFLMGLLAFGQGLYEFFCSCSSSSKSSSDDERAALTKLEDDDGLPGTSSSSSKCCSAYYALVGTKPARIPTIDGERDMSVPYQHPAVATKFEAVITTPQGGKTASPTKPLLRADVVIGRTGLKASFVVGRETRLAVTGATGSGKTSLLKVLARLDEPASGVLQLDGPRGDVPPWRTRVRYVAQDRPTLSGCPRDLYDTVRRYRAQRHRGLTFHDDAPARIAANWDLPAEKFLQPWFSLSGGEAQRANLAIALALQPDVLLLDEFTSALDDHTTSLVEKDVLALNAGIVLVTHSPDQANRLCHTHLRIHPRRERERSATLPLLV